MVDLSVDSVLDFVNIEYDDYYELRQTRENAFVTSAYKYIKEQ